MYAAVIAFILFVLSLIFQVANFTIINGHIAWQTLMIGGLVFIAVHLTGWHSHHRGTPVA